MAYETRTYDDKWGTPVVVMVVTGDHDVSRIVHLLGRGQCEHLGVRDLLVRQLQRHNVGRAALKLLADHGGPDLLERATTDPASSAAPDTGGQG